MIDRDKVHKALAELGLCIRGIVRFAGSGGSGGSGHGVDDLAASLLADGRLAHQAWLIGYLGGDMWPVFADWHGRNAGCDDPLDRWSKTVIAPIADLVGGEAVFPSDEPWHPFQAWAMAAEGLEASPLGMLIHAQYGFWHGYRGAILFGDAIDAGLQIDDLADVRGGQLSAETPEAANSGSRHPCVTCEGKPCLSACPVGAFDGHGFDVTSCRSYLATQEGTETCLATGCRARDACPVGKSHRFPEAQIRFHMRAFG